MTTQPLTQAQIDSYVSLVQSKVNAYWAKQGYTFAAAPIITVDTNGQRYVRVVINDADKEGNIAANGSRSVHSFLDRTNGDILKGSWKAPVKNGVRGNVNNPDHEDRINHHGPNYLR